MYIMKIHTPRKRFKLYTWLWEPRKSVNKSVNKSWWTDLSGKKKANLSIILPAFGSHILSLGDKKCIDKTEVRSIHNEYYNEVINKYY